MTMRQTIDIRLLVNKSQKLNPMKQFTKNGIEVEIDEMNWQWLTGNLAVDSDQRWIREKSIILYDPQKQIAEKFLQLAALMKTETQIQLWQYFKDAFYSNEIEKCFKRYDLETTNLYFYKAVDSIFKFIFLYHNQPVLAIQVALAFLTKNKLLSSQTIKQLQEIILSSKPAEFKQQTLASIEKYLQN